MATGRFGYRDGSRDDWLRWLPEWRPRPLVALSTGMAATTTGYRDGGRDDWPLWLPGCEDWPRWLLEWYEVGTDV